MPTTSTSQSPSLNRGMGRLSDATAPRVSGRRARMRANTCEHIFAAAAPSPHTPAVAVSPSPPMRDVGRLWTSRSRARAPARRSLQPNCSPLVTASPSPYALTEGPREPKVWRAKDEREVRRPRVWRARGTASEGYGEDEGQREPADHGKAASAIDGDTKDGVHGRQQATTTPNPRRAASTTEGAHKGRRAKGSDDDSQPGPRTATTTARDDDGRRGRRWQARRTAGWTVQPSRPTTGASASEAADRRARRTASRMHHAHDGTPRSKAGRTMANGQTDEKEEGRAARHVIHKPPLNPPLPTLPDGGTGRPRRRPTASAAPRASNAALFTYVRLQPQAPAPIHSALHIPLPLLGCTAYTPHHPLTQPSIGQPRRTRHILLNPLPDDPWVTTSFDVSLHMASMAGRVRFAETLLAKTKAKKKYKPVALKVRPVVTGVDEKFRIIREIKGDPLATLPTLPTNPPKFTPIGRYTQERMEAFDAVHEEGFLEPAERDLLHHFVGVHNDGFAWNDSEQGHFREDFFPPVEIPVIPHKPWVQRNIPIPPGIHDQVCEVLKRKMNAGVMEPSNSSYRSRWFCVVKKDGKLRIVQSLEPLN
ncbi:hypothetical protein BJ912DRAFT_1105001 [Pholiota molesta]|nr:hypothetical protein BJ912DRAFT_1105001 [Pholiota molesta]